MSADPHSPYAPPTSSFDEVLAQQPDSKWLYVIAIFFCLPFLLIGSVGVMDEMKHRSDLHPFVVLYGFSIASGFLLNATAPFAVRWFARKHWQRLRGRQFKHLYLLAYVYSVPFSLSGVFWLSRPESHTALPLLLTVVIFLSLLIAFGLFCWFLLMYGLMAWRLRWVAKRR